MQTLWYENKLRMRSIPRWNTLLTQITVATDLADGSCQLHTTSIRCIFFLLSSCNRWIRETGIYDYLRLQGIDFCCLASYAYDGEQQSIISVIVEIPPSIKISIQTTCHQTSLSRETKQIASTDRDRHGDNSFKTRT